MEFEDGIITRVAGPVVEAKNMKGAEVYEVVYVGKEGLIGEIIGLHEDRATIQVYEETSGIGPGELVKRSGAPLSLILGPGLIGQIYDGIQRPLPAIMETAGDFISRGVSADPIDFDKKWYFVPVAEKGEKVLGGDIIGKVQEGPVVEHRIMIPPDISGELVEIVSEGEYTLKEAVARVKTSEGIKDIFMYQKWPVRHPRPVKKKLAPAEPLITGQRILDTFFPMAKGGTAAIPGGFGTGKTVTQHQLAKWADAEIVIYVGCGERGNEMTDVLREFPELVDPKTGKPLMNRTILIANTSNMPVAAREASVYTGITLAEYYRDMGYNVALMADSTSRWAEAMREISGRLEEMPGEEGYPAYLASKLAAFYERAGKAVLEGSEEKIASISVIGAVSPPGGDLSEPVTQNTLRIVKVFWALDTALKERRHFPSINWLRSYSLYLDAVRGWWQKEIGEDWFELRSKAMALLQKEAELQEIVQLVGPDALPPAEQATLEGARVIREDFLQQNAFHEIDTYCPPKKQYLMVKIMLEFYDLIMEAVRKGVDIAKIRKLKCKGDLSQMARVSNETYEREFADIGVKMRNEIRQLIKEVES